MATIKGAFLYLETQCSINMKLLPVLILPLGGWDACYCIAVVSRRTVETVFLVSMSDLTYR